MPNKHMCVVSDQVLLGTPVIGVEAPTFPSSDWLLPWCLISGATWTCCGTSVISASCTLSGHTGDSVTAGGGLWTLELEAGVTEPVGGAVESVGGSTMLAGTALDFLSGSLDFGVWALRHSEAAGVGTDGWGGTTCLGFPLKNQAPDLLDS